MAKFTNLSQRQLQNGQRRRLPEQELSRSFRLKLRIQNMSSFKTEIQMAIAVGKMWEKTHYLTSGTLISFGTPVHYFTSLCILVRYTTHARGMQSHCFYYCTNSFVAIHCP